MTGPQVAAGGRPTGERPEDFTEEEVEAALAGAYVSLPIADHAALAAAVNKCLEDRFGPAPD